MTEPLGSLVSVDPLCAHVFGLMSAQNAAPKKKPLLILWCYCKKKVTTFSDTLEQIKGFCHTSLQLGHHFKRSVVCNLETK